MKTEAQTQMWKKCESIKPFPVLPTYSFLSSPFVPRPFCAACAAVYRIHFGVCLRLGVLSRRRFTDTVAAAIQGRPHDEQALLRPALCTYSFFCIILLFRIRTQYQHNLGNLA
jgi:hypothetical protein